MLERRRLLIQGVVQGVGFRPFIYRLAMEFGIRGWVSNSSQGVILEAEAPTSQLDAFINQIQSQKPPHSLIQRMTSETIPSQGELVFSIQHSQMEGSRTTLVLPDLATCTACQQEIFDPTNRRFQYPFTNCTHCGPRYTIIEQLPYDRLSTTMRAFAMCDVCRAEYENPLDRRFHAQPNACPHCGPQLAWWDAHGTVLASQHEALLAAANAICNGAIVALKGMGGFQLLVDARQTMSIQRLRERKQRPAKPLAVMVPTLGQIQALCEVSTLETELLRSSAAPIVLLRQHLHAILSEDIGPANPNLGVMLPYTPLHHLLMDELGFPIVATSGNLAGEPICIDEQEALQRLRGIADYFLVHNRPIVRPVDDSVIRVMAGTAVTIRRARGYAPLPLTVAEEHPATLAYGAHLKNTVAMSVGPQVFLSQHIGDLDAPEAVATSQQVLADLQQLYEQQPAVVACDLHPDYHSTHLARAMAKQAALPVVAVQHHYAHSLACMAEHQLCAPVLGIAWDGTGYGTDGTIWGGEFLYITEHSFERCAHWQPFPLVGGDQAIREPRRAALGMLYTCYGADLPDSAAIQFSATERSILLKALAHNINAPLTSSMGRVFDAVAALIGLRQVASFEGQAAMELEFAADRLLTTRVYPFDMQSIATTSGRFEYQIIWKPMLAGILADLSAGISSADIAAIFHHTLAHLTVTLTHRLAQHYAFKQVVLSGGCFQNKYLLELVVDHLQQAGWPTFWSQQFPPNDGSIALGQIMAAWRQPHTEN